MSALDELALRTRRLRIASLDHADATHQCALLMAMDGTSADPVDILLAMPTATLAAATTLLDVLDLMRAPVTMSASLPLRSVAAALFAAHPGERLLHRRSRLELRLESDRSPHTHIESAAAAVAAQRTGLVTRIAERSSLDEQQVDELLDKGGYLDASRCVEIGLADGTI